MKKKKITLSIITIILLIILIILLITKSQNQIQPRQTNKIESSNQALEYVEKLNDLIIKGGSKKQLEEFGIDIDNIPASNIMTGQDSYLRLKPNNQIIKQYKLTKYVKKSEKLAKNLENKIEDNFEFKSGGIVEADSYYSVLSYYKSFYYNEYILDFNNLVNHFIQEKNINVEEKLDNKTIAEIYKIQVKTMEILDSHLNEYNNQNEFHQAYVLFSNKTIKDSTTSLNSYFLSITDFYHKNTNTKEESEKRVKKYLEQL